MAASNSTTTRSLGTQPGRKPPRYHKIVYEEVAIRGAASNDIPGKADLFVAAGAGVDSQAPSGAALVYGGPPPAQ
jgi:hypothetical protein